MQTKKIKLNSIKQLIDLNGDKVNFDLTFEVKTFNNTPFEALVVTQTILDSGEDLKYKNVSEGIINGNIVADKGIYDNYFILLKAKEEVECEINIDIKDIPINNNLQQRIYQPRRTQEQINMQQQEQKQGEKLGLRSQKQNDVKQDKKINWRLILTISILILGSFVLWYFYKNSIKNILKINLPNNSRNNLPNNSRDNLPTILPSILPNNSPVNLSNNLPNKIIQDTPLLYNDVSQSITNMLNNDDIPSLVNQDIINKNVSSSLNEPLAISKNLNSKLLSKINNIPIW